MDIFLQTLITGILYYGAVARADPLAVFAGRQQFSPAALHLFSMIRWCLKTTACRT